MPKAISDAGEARRAAPSLISHAATMAKQGFRNSEGCTDIPGSAIQRRAPLISTPITSGRRGERQRDDAAHDRDPRMLRGDSSDTATTIAPASSEEEHLLEDEHVARRADAFGDRRADAASIMM